MKKILALSLIIAIINSGCYGIKQAEKQTVKAYNHYPVMVAAKTRTWFPCITTKQDTLLQTYYDTVNQEKIVVNTVFKNDTAFTEKIIYRDKIVTKYTDRIITKTVEDSAKIKVLSSGFLLLEEKYKSETFNLRQQLTDAQNRAGNRAKWLWRLGIALALSVAWNFRKLIFKVFI